jgi:hypothetical protein
MLKFFLFAFLERDNDLFSSVIAKMDRAPWTRRTQRVKKIYLRIKANGFYRRDTVRQEQAREERKEGVCWVSRRAAPAKRLTIPLII